MSLVNEENGGMVMPVAPMMNGGYGANNGFGFGDGSFWIIILFLFAMMGGWGNGFGFGGGGAMPYMMNNNTNNDVQRGFDQQAIMSGINGISQGLASAEVSRCNDTASIIAAATANQMANMQQAYTTQMANMQQSNAMQSALQNYCCENRAAIADLKYTVGTENCADRQAISDGARDIVASGTANTQLLLNTINNGIQSIQDKLCQQEIDALKTQNANLQTQLNIANLQGSQTAQTAQILAGQAAQTAALEQYLNPNCCSNNFSNGCGCGGSY